MNRDLRSVERYWTEEIRYIYWAVPPGPLGGPGVPGEATGSNGGRHFSC